MMLLDESLKLTPMAKKKMCGDSDHPEQGRRTSPTLVDYLMDYLKWTTAMNR